MTITAKFESVCPTCRQRIAVGSQVNWERGGKASHVECPKGALLALRILEQPAETQRANVTALCDALTSQVVQGDGRVVLTEALDAIEAELFRLYEQTTGRVAGSQRTDQWGNLREGKVTAVTPADSKGAQRLAALAQLQKGIYRVSLTGQERRYGVDHVNLQLTPSPKYGTVKVAEYQRDGIGRIDKDGQFRYWPSFEDRTGVRTLAILAAVDIVLGSADPIEYAKAYAVEAAACYRCGADLVDEKSRARLLGPECYRQVSKGA